MIWEVLDENLIIPELDASNSDEVFEKLGGRLIEQGYCKDTYINALKEREKNYPTGIDLGGINFAMPHTDSQHVNKTAIAIGVLKNPVHFYHMGTTDRDVTVNLIFMLAVENPNEHIGFIGGLLELFQDQDLLEKLTKAKTPKDIVEIFKEKELKQ
ncbi:MAG: PTS sugar transporter subunit IIA [Tyzzerella sp.]|uniref:PTS sugar transporter subunit IIA n=1 Tax=Candidatus Fimicola merdigallinarum TaxID=2840819 RepID=A0A9D9H5A1_9FIRM|nr:PTS sugar transporter subunit IIA [Candidatus Fimicola merdigallinarum]